MKLKVGIVGVTGYVGKELIRILIQHEKVEITSLSAKIDATIPISKIFPEFKHIIDVDCINFENADEIAEVVDVAFLALPHTVSMNIVPKFLDKGKKVIDLSADFRLRNAKVYEQWYNVKHNCPELINEAVYGLPELYSDEIKKANLVANPGCYPTSAILGLAPLLREGLIEAKGIVIDAKSGISGAGREPSLKTHFPERNESLCAYSVGTHRHIPEIEQELSRLEMKEIKVTFVPHLIPMDRGILSTIYLFLNKKVKVNELFGLYREFYSSYPFIRITDEFPETKWVIGSNYCDINIRKDEKTEQIVILSTIDNLIKGASGQAVQNMNLMYGFEETLGIE